MAHMKGKLLIVLLMGFSISVYSQKAKPPNLVLFDYQQFHFGYSVGINYMGFTALPIDDYTINLKQYPGLNINLVTNYRLNKNLDIRFLPGIQFSQRDLSINSSEPWKIESVYIDLPIDLKYRADRINNYAPYLIAGIAPRIDLTGGEIQNWRAVQRLLKPFDIYPELGFGFDFYLQEVKLAAELKFSVGLLNIYQNPGTDPAYQLFAQGVDRILSRMVILAIHVE